MHDFNAYESLKSIYINGFSGIKDPILFDYKLLEESARKKLKKAYFDYIFTGAGNHAGVSNNESAFKTFSIVPRMASGKHKVKLESDILNTKLPVPLLFAPIGVLELVHSAADLELAKTSLELQIPMIFSSQASIPMEKVSSLLNQTDRWFQLYFGKSYELVESFVHRAESCGHKAIVLTLDTTTLGWRSLDLGNGFLPFMHGMGIAQYTSDPVFNKMLDNEQKFKHRGKWTWQMGRNVLSMFRNYPGGLLSNLISQRPSLAVKKFIDIYSKPDLNWNDIKWLKSITHLPIILKGILHPEDALKAMDLGIDGIIVSNHGGRQVDKVISSLKALRHIKNVLPDDYPILLDSGIRNGSDVFIALALGAKAVLIGRPYVYSMSLNGSAGVKNLMLNISSELEITMQLCGISDVRQITPDCLNEIRFN